MKSIKVTMMLLVVGGFGSIWLLSQPWITATLFEPGMPAVEANRTGATLYPVSFGAAWLAVACAIAFFAFGAKVRRVLGVVLVFCGAGILISPIAFYLTDALEQFSQEHASYQSIAVETNKLIWLMILFGLAVFLAGVATMLWSQSWATLSGRQSNSTTPKTRSDWDSFDLGDDPTAEPVVDPAVEPPADPSRD